MRKYLIPAKIRCNTKIFDQFKNWIKEDRNLLVTHEEPFTFLRDNGRICATYSDGQCNRQFLATARHFLMSELNYYPKGTH